MRSGQKNQSGFTLIELVMVIVILGILAAVALPRFVDLRGESRVAALAGVVGGITSASGVNAAARSAGNTAATTATIGLTCQTAAAAILQGGLPAGYTLDNTTLLVAGDNNCTVTQDDGGAVGAAVIFGI